MSIEEQRRTMVLTRLRGGLGVGGGAGDTARPVGAIGLATQARFLADGPAGLVHGNRGAAIVSSSGRGRLRNDP